MAGKVLVNLLCWIIVGPNVAAGRPPVVRPQLRDELLCRSRRAIRAGKLELAEALVMEYGDSGLSDAACLNVLGVIAELRGHWTHATRFWRKALRADRQYAAASQNIRRYFELWNWGRSECQRALGDETMFDLSPARSIRRGH